MTQLVIYQCIMIKFFDVNGFVKNASFGPKNVVKRFKNRYIGLQILISYISNENVDSLLKTNP